jgi:hypothetical protein
MPRKELDPMMGAEVLEMGFEAEPSDDMTAEDRDLQSTLQALMNEAINHYEEHLEPDQTDATDYYHGRLPKPAGKGRSSVVSTDVRDTVLDRIPDFLEIFMGSDSVVEFQPTGPEDVSVAEQQTDYVNHLFWVKNPGFRILNAVFKDAEIRRLGYVKWQWEHTSRVEGETHTGLTEEELLILSEDEDVDDYDIVREYEGVAPQMDPETGATVLVPVALYDCEVQRTIKGGALKVCEVPNEEIVWTPNARSLEQAHLVAHVREVPKDELIRLGIPEALIEENTSRRESRSSESLAWARQFYRSDSKRTALQDRAEVSDESQDPVVFAEAYALIDADGDGVAELRMFQLVGPDFVVNPEKPRGELVSHVPIAVFTPDPEPHTIPGLCTADHTISIQRVKTDVQRAQLNSLSQAVEPVLAVLDRMVNLGDLLNPEVSGIVRVKGDVNNSIREIKTQFVGAETLDVLAYYDTLKGERTGQAGPREGLDPNVLQSTTREAVSSNLSKGQRRIMMTARAYAEIGMTQMFRGILKTVIENSNKAEVARLRNQWVEVDPRSWHAERDVTINVALGTGSKGERIESLFRIAAIQEAHIQNGSPLVTFSELYATYAKITDLLGHKDTTTFFRPWSEEQQAQMEQQKAQQPPADPAMAIAQAEQMRVQAEIQLDQMKFELEQWKAQRQDDRERDKLARESALKEFEIELKHKAEIIDAELKAKVAADRAVMDADIKREQVRSQAGTESA